MSVLACFDLKSAATGRLKKAIETTKSTREIQNNCQRSTFNWHVCLGKNASSIKISRIAIPFWKSTIAMEPRHDLHWKQCLKRFGSVLWLELRPLHFSKKGEIDKGVAALCLVPLTHEFGILCLATTHQLQEKLAVKSCNRCRFIKHGRRWAQCCVYTDNQGVVRLPGASWE